MDWMSIGKTLKKAREERGLTQKDIAVALKISVTAYWKYENGRCCISFENLKKICEMLNININDL